MVYTINRPTASEKLKTSQPLIRDNFNQLNTSFGVDHYKFDDGTANNGFHNQITTPELVGGGEPITTTNPILYAEKKSNNLGVLQYSKGPNQAVPTPITTRMSGAPIIMVPGNVITVFDFTGLTQAMCILYAANLDAGADHIRRVMSFVRWINNGTGTALQLTDILDTSGQSLISQSTGNILQLKNTSNSTTLNNVTWQLQFTRVN